MGSFEFPKNIKQIGTIEEGMKIYIEDYVCTYLSQYAEGSGYDERLAFLVGRCMVIDGQNILFISGCIQSMYCIYEKGIVSFSDKSWDYAKEQQKRYFKDQQIVGWMQSQPGYGIHLNTNYANYHRDNFISKEHVLFVLDPIEKVNAFYVWNEAIDNLAETKGYFIYYDKNRNMHEYMMDHRIVSKIKLKDIPITKEDLKHKDKPDVSDKAIFLTDKAKRIERLEEYVSEGIERRANAEEYFKPIIRERQAVRAAKYASTKQKRAVNMLMSVSAVMLIICLGMGAGLVQNDGRISTLERQLTQLNTAYRDLLLQISDGKSSSVFAAENESNEDIEDEIQAAVITPVPTAVVTPAPTVAPTAAPTITPSAVPTPTVAPTEIPAPAVGTVQTSYEPPAEAEEITEVPATDTPEPQEKLNLDPERIPATYTVQQGDNLSYISQIFYGDRSMVSKIMEINGITDPDKVNFGTVLILPR